MKLERSVTLPSPARGEGFKKSLYFIRYCVNHLSAGVEALSKPAT